MRGRLPQQQLLLQQPQPAELSLVRSQQGNLWADVLYMRVIRAHVERQTPVKAALS